jgi:hypothetical protein
MRTIIAIMFVVLVLPAIASADDQMAEEERDEVAAELELEGAEPRLRRVRGPAIAAVLGAAYHAAGLDRDPSRGWITRARLAGLVPYVTVRTGRNTRWQDNDQDIDYGMAFEVRASWRLDRLVFDGRELQVASIEAARRRERRRLASRVIRVYFAWWRAAERANQPAMASREHEAAAELDALTDGWFSDALAPAASFSASGVRRSTSEPRTSMTRR